MTNDRVEPDDLHLIDTHFLDQPGAVGVYCIDAEKPTLVDAGTSKTVGTVLDGLERIGLSPEELEKIVLTHLHLDHAGGVGGLLEECENAEVFCHEGGRRFLTDADAARRLVEGAHRVLGNLGPAYGEFGTVAKNRVHGVSAGDRLDLGNGYLELLEASGHSPRQLCPYHPGSGTLFTGDEVGVRMDGTVVPASPPPDFRYEETLRSLEALEERDPDRLAFPHFGWCESPRQAIREYRETLGTWVTMVRRFGEEYDTLSGVVDRLVEEGIPHQTIWPESVARKLVSVDAAGVLRADE